MNRGEQRMTVAGSLLKTARFDLGISQRELADRAGVAQSTIARIESGRTDTGLENLYRILAAIGLEPQIQLEQLDDHDRVLEEREARLSDEDRMAKRERHRKIVEQFRNARRAK
jgi:transcriptional regulator with XRE-family HTH domain